jgi:hypothetical protein
MKKNVLVFGLISGLIVVTLCLTFIALCYKAGHDGNMYIGYASQILALSLVFVGVKNYRDKENGGIISFGQALKSGILISLVASTIYVIGWLIDYYVFMPDFMDKYADHVLSEAQHSGKTAVEISKATAEMAKMKELYKNPVFVVLFTYVEIFPTGLIISIITALILKKKASDPVMA